MASVSTYLVGWSYYVPVTIDNTGNTSNLSYYQVPVTISGSLYTSWAAHGKADGSDLRVTDSDGVTLLPFALEGIDTTNQAVYLLAKVPGCAAGSSKTIYVYWGNASATSVSSYPGTIKNNRALTTYTDIFTQSNSPHYNAEASATVLRHQTGANTSHNGDILTTVDLKHLLDFHEDHKAAATMCVSRYSIEVPFGVIDVDQHRITRIAEKPVYRFLVSAGIYVLQPDVVGLVPAATRYDMPSLFDRLVAEGRETCVFPLGEYWADIGRIDDIERANRDYDGHFAPEKNRTP